MLRCYSGSMRPFLITEFQHVSAFVPLASREHKGEVGRPIRCRNLGIDVEDLRGRRSLMVSIGRRQLDGTRRRRWVIV
jgi:hypothetical protein